MDEDAEGPGAPGPTVSAEVGAPAGATPGKAGWHADPWSTTRWRWWTGQSWTFSTADVRPDDVQPSPPPQKATPLPAGSIPGLTSIGDSDRDEEKAGPTRRVLGVHPLVIVLVLGVLAGLLGAWVLNKADRPTTGTGGSAAGGPNGSTPAPTDPASPSVNNDPSASALASLIVKPADVASSLTVTLLPGGIGLSQPTLDLCNATYPSESRRTARVQDVVIDDQDDLPLSTEAVLYGDQAGAAQAFSELKAVSARCPATLVPSPVGGRSLITRFNAPPDGNWPPTATVNRLAFDLTTADELGQTSHTVAVYLQRGRVLLGVYFSKPDGVQIAVAGQTTVPGIVGVFAERVAALPTSVVGA